MGNESKSLSYSAPTSRVYASYESPFVLQEPPLIDSICTVTHANPTARSQGQDTSRCTISLNMPHNIQPKKFLRKKRRGKRKETPEERYPLPTTRSSRSLDSFRTNKSNRAPSLT